jgi:hypothetical protein
MLKNIIVFYIVLFLPFIFIWIWLKEDPGNLWWAWLIFAAVYHPVVTGTRLRQKGLITQNEFKKLFIPFNTILRDHFVDLYFRA